MLAVSTVRDLGIYTDCVCVYWLKPLRSQSLPIQQLHTVFVASRISYTLPAWGRQLTRQLQERLDAFLKRARKFGFCDKDHGSKIAMINFMKNV